MNLENIPTGLSISMSLTDTDAAAFAAKYLNEHDAEVKDLIRQKLGVSLDITDPAIRFGQDEITVSARAGKGFMKVTASANAQVRWDGQQAEVSVRSLDLPIVSIDPSRANGLIQKPIQAFVGELQQAFEIRSFRVEPGCISIQAVKK